MTKKSCTDGGNPKKKSFVSAILVSTFNFCLLGHLKEELAGPLEIRQPNQVVAELVQVSSSQQSREQVR